jgi:hypothetical protein
MSFFLGAMLFYASVVNLPVLLRHDGDGDAR